MSVRITGEKSRVIYYLSQRLSNWDIQSLDAGEIGDIRVLKSLDMMSIEVNDTKISSDECRESFIYTTRDSI